MNHIGAGFNGSDVVGHAKTAVLVAVPVNFDVPALVACVLDDLLVDEGEEFLDAVGRDVTAGIAHAKAAHTEFHGTLVDHLDIFGIGPRGILGDKHHGDVVVNGIGDGLFHRGHEFLHRPAFGVLTDGAGAQESGGLDFHFVLGLHLHQRFDISHQGPNGRTRADGVVVFPDVSEHGIDVVAMERASPWQAEVDLLQTELFHVAEKFNLLLDGGVACAGALKTVAQGFIVKPNPVRMVVRITLEVVLHRVPIVNQRTLVHQSHRRREGPLRAEDIGIPFECVARLR